MSATAGTTLAQRLLCLRLTSGVCVAGAVGAAICAATGGTAPAIIAISALMTQAAAYGNSRLAARADQAHADLAKQADELTRGLRNADVHRLMGRAVSLALRVHAQETDTNDGLRAVLTTLAAAVDAQWPALDEGTLPEALRESNVSAYFDQAPEEIKAQPVLDAALWRSTLEPIADKGKATLTDAEWQSVGAVLTARYPRALYAVAKTAAIDGDPAWPGLLLRLLAEQRGVMDFAAHEITHTRRQTEKNTEHLHDIKDALADIKVALAQLGDLGATRIEALLNAKDTRDDARYRSLFALVKAEGQRMREGLSFVWTLAGRTEAAQADMLAKFDGVLTKLDGIASDTGFLRKQFEAHGVRVVPPATNNFDLANITDNAETLKGRDGVIADLHARLTAADASRVVVLRAGTGQGKSAVARRYVFAHAQRWPHRYWLHAQTGALEPSALALLARIDPGSSAKEPADVRAAILGFAARVGALLVLDNVDDPAQIARWRPNLPARAIATSIKGGFSTHDGEEFALPALDEEAADAILWSRRPPPRPPVTRARVAFGGAATGERTDALAGIAEHVAFNPLGLNYMAAALSKTRYTDPAGLLRDLRANSLAAEVHPATAVKSGQAAADYHATNDGSPRGMVDAYDILVRDVMNTPAAPVLLAAACLNADGITADLLAAGAGLERDATADALDALRDEGLLEWHGTVASIHRFTQDMARARAGGAGDAKGTQTLSRLLDALIELFRWPGTVQEELVDHTKTPARLAAVAHAEAVIGHAEAGGRAGREGAAAPLPRTPTPAEAEVAGERGAKAARLRAEMARRLTDAGQLADAARHIDAALAWGEAQTPRDERSLAIWYASRARIRQLRGDLKGAEADIKKAIDWGEDQSPRDERGLAILYASRASIRQDRGDLKGAEEDIQKSIDWGKAQSPRDERSLAIRYASRASIRQDKGDLKGAEEDIQKSIDWGEAQSPRDERSLAIDYASRASIRQDRGDLKGAEEDIQKSIDWGEDQSPRDERSLAIDYASRARIRRDLKQYALAHADIDAALAWWLANLPGDERGLTILRQIKVSIHAAEKE